MTAHECIIYADRIASQRAAMPAGDLEAIFLRLEDALVGCSFFIASPRAPYSQWMLGVGMPVVKS